MHTILCCEGFVHYCVLRRAMVCFSSYGGEGFRPHGLPLSTVKPPAKFWREMSLFASSCLIHLKKSEKTAPSHAFSGTTGFTGSGYSPLKPLT